MPEWVTDEVLARHQQELSALEEDESKLRSARRLHREREVSADTLGRAQREKGEAIRDTATNNYVIGMLSSNASRRQQAAERFAEAAHQWSSPTWIAPITTIELGLQDEPEIKAPTLRILSAFAFLFRIKRPEILRAVADPQEHQVVRVAAVHALRAGLPDPLVENTLVRLLNINNPELCLEVCRVLIESDRVARPSVVKSLVDMAVAQRCPVRFRTAAISALENHASDELADVADRLEPTVHPQVRKALDAATRR